MGRRRRDGKDGNREKVRIVNLPENIKKGFRLHKGLSNREVHEEGERTERFWTLRATL